MRRFSQNKDWCLRSAVATECFLTSAPRIIGNIIMPSLLCCFRNFRRSNLVPTLHQYCPRISYWNWHCTWNGQEGPLFYITNNLRCSWKWMLHTFAGRWTQCSDQEGDAAASCGPSNRAQDGSMWATREPTSGAWRTRGTYLSIGSLREQDFRFSFLHILQKTGLRCYPIGTVTKTLFYEKNYCCIVKIKTIGCT
jgi:hypothetical protein